MSEFLEFSQGMLQEIALVIMALVYTTRLFWWFRFKEGKDRQPQTGSADTTPKKGAMYSVAIIAMPWAMESSRSKLLNYGQFVIFHLGVVAAISMSFLIPYLPQLMEPTAVTLLLQIVIGAAFLVGCIRILRRITVLRLRKISSPDDYFSLILLTGWFLSAVLAAPNDPANGEASLIAFFLLTAFFLLYVPFSKISHYLYYPFTRYWLGRSLGHRGSFPMKRGA
jgi:nitrate reductase gamma subunit